MRDDFFILYPSAFIPHPSSLYPFFLGHAYSVLCLYAAEAVQLAG